MIHRSCIALVALLAVVGLCACSYGDLSQYEDAMSVAENEEIKSVMPQDLLTYQNTNERCSLTENTKAYRVGPEDELSILIFEEEDLSGEYTVDNVGKISMPLIGDVLLSGCTLRQVEKILIALYADGFLVNPSISIEISKYRPFYILGEIKHPGQYDFVSGINILKATAIAGGFTYRANKKYATVFRRNIQGEISYMSSTIETNVYPGDVIMIKERFF
jgi:polysaccharide export outer membrane protein